MIHFKALLSFEYILLIVAATEKFQCQSAIGGNTSMSPSPRRIQYGIATPVLCMALCSQLPHTCTTCEYISAMNLCQLYSAILTPFSRQPGQLCQRDSIASTTEASSTIQLSSTTQFSPTVELSSTTDFPDYANTTYNVTISGRSCRTLTSCLRQQSLQLTLISQVSSWFDCYALCAKCSDCLAFTYGPNTACSIANQTSQLTLMPRIGSLTCFCLAADTTTKPITVTANTFPVTTTPPSVQTGTRFPNVSCYPTQLFSGSSYPRISMANGRSADCSCQGGLDMVNDAYVHAGSKTFVDCLNECNSTQYPPCKAFSFREEINECIIGPTSSSGNGDNLGILTCFT